MSERLATSTKEISQYHIAVEDANTLISRACLGVLLRDTVGDNGATTPPLARYAAEHWVAHAQVENVASRIRDGMKRLFDPDRSYFSAWVKLHDVGHCDWPDDTQLKIQPGAAPLYYAAFGGFHEIVEHLALKHPQYVNTVGGETGTALHSASDQGHVEVVRLLLKCGVDVDSRGRWNKSPLLCASLEGRLDVVQCLLDHGADANFQDVYHITPLIHAVARGHLEIVRVLLEHNADVNSQSNIDGSTPMHVAFIDSAPGGDGPQIVRLLLGHGANPNTRDNKHQTPLHLASSPRRLTSSTMHLASSPLHLTSSLQLELARILLAHGADVDAKDEKGRTPLQAALEEGQTELVQLLSGYCFK